MTIYQPKVSKSCFGVHGDEEIPVIIPNTEVKLISGDYTAMRETSTMPNYRETLRKGSFSFMCNKLCIKNGIIWSYNYLQMSLIINTAI